ncbi:MAG: MATE family efflux transporter [Oscillospiraceae bacterium]|nr:MATE family efflux transporter [Oscillospiraceae bacterium]
MDLKMFIGDRKFYRKMFSVMIPVFIQNVITNFVNLLDNIMVGQVGTEPMSGVAIVNQLFFVFSLCMFAAVAAAGIFTAQYYGKGDHEGVRATMRLKFWAAALIAVIAFAALLLFNEKLISLFLHEGKEDLDLQAAFSYAKDYLGIMYLQIIPFAVIQVYAGTLRDTGETMLPMKAGIAAVLINLVFNYIFIFGKLGFPAMGVKGAAVATVIARLSECAIVVIRTHVRKAELSFVSQLYSTLRVPGGLVRDVTKMGMPLLMNELLWSSGMTILNQCYSMRGLEVVSATNIASTITNLFFCAVLSMGSTVSILVGQRLGAGELEQAVDDDRKLIAFAVVMCSVVGGVMLLLAPQIPKAYNTSDSVRTLAARLIMVSACMMPFTAYTTTCYFTLRSGGKTIITFLFDSVYVWVLCIPAAFILSRFTEMKILPMYCIVQSLEFIKCVIGYFFLKSRKWVNNLVA